METGFGSGSPFDIIIRREAERSRYEFFVGVDLGQAQDYTGIAVLEKGQIYQVRHLVRHRSVPYPTIVDQINSLMHSKELAEAPTSLIVDQTGVGAPVVDFLKDRGLLPKTITITGGDKPQATDEWKRNWRVPKRDLVSNLVVLSQSNRLKIAADLKEAKTLADELQNLRVKINPYTAHDSYTTWREGQHDDLVLAVALAAWWAECRPKPRLVMTKYVV
jgi:hypothetical protein